MSKNYLIIFIKYPEQGKVKTRLSKDIGKEKATMLYKFFVEALLNHKSLGCLPQKEIDNDLIPNKNNYELALFFTPNEKKDSIKEWLGDKYMLYPQVGNNLGERLLNAFKTISNLGAKKIVIIGSDTPALKKELINESFDFLNKNDIVIGPTIDGGYYLIGLSFTIKTYDQFKDCKIFSGIDWSTENVFSQTITKIKQNKFTYDTLPEYYDIDNVKDLYLLKEDIYRTSRTNSKKAEHLAEIYNQLEFL